jgi:hypothetical protein
VLRIGEEASLLLQRRAQPVEQAVEAHAEPPDLVARVGDRQASARSRRVDALGGVGHRGERVQHAPRHRPAGREPDERQQRDADGEPEVRAPVQRLDLGARGRHAYPPRRRLALPERKLARAHGRLERRHRVVARRARRDDAAARSHELDAAIVEEDLPGDVLHRRVDAAVLRVFHAVEAAHELQRAPDVVLEAAIEGRLQRHVQHDGGADGQHGDGARVQERQPSADEGRAGPHHAPRDPRAGAATGSPMR